jgi:hypothetical protein
VAELLLVEKRIAAACHHLNSDGEIMGGKQQHQLSVNLTVEYRVCPNGGINGSLLSCEQQQQAVVVMSESELLASGGGGGGEWTEWSVWSVCTCANGGEQTRRRACKSGGGDDKQAAARCLGEMIERRLCAASDVAQCKTVAAAAESGWGCWSEPEPCPLLDCSAFSSSTPAADMARARRTRHCLVSANANDHNEKKWCAGASEDYVPCFNPNCTITTSTSNGNLLHFVSNSYSTVVII